MSDEVFDDADALLMIRGGLAAVELIEETAWPVETGDRDRWRP